MPGPCYICDNAHTNPELHKDNDLSYISIGDFARGYRMLLRSGDGRPTEVLVEKWHEKAGWSLIGRYRPKYCPNCGRELIENREKEEKTT